MTRRCSHCNHNGHNSRTCPNRPGGGGSGSGGGGNGQGLKLFGVRLVEASPMKKSASMGCLMHYSSLAAAAGDSPSSDLVGEGAVEASGYASDDPNRASCSSNRRGDRKKGTPWTEEEHRKFLLGLHTLGKGDWRGISRKFVVTRTPTQVASHAQKYFIRQTNTTRRRRRSSLFDMPVDHAAATDEQVLPATASTEYEQHAENPHPCLDLDLTLKRESPIQDTTNDKPEIQPSAASASLPPIMPVYYPAYVPVPIPYWSLNVCLVANTENMSQSHVIMKPTPLVVKGPNNADEVVAMSNLRIREAANGCTTPVLSSQMIVGSTSRPSAFHATPTAAASDVSSSNGSVIHAV